MNNHTPRLRLADLAADARAGLHGRHGTGLADVHLNALHAIVGCRTGTFGGRLMQCSDCPHTLHVPRSCGHRSCPRCQQRAASAWLERQHVRLLPVQYFMATFTLPSRLRPLAAQQPAIVYDALFAAAASTLMTFGQNHRDREADLGFASVLHTHSRRLNLHPHVHVVIPGRGDSGQHEASSHDRVWRELPKKYLFHGRALASVFRARMIDALKAAGLTLPAGVQPRWIVHCKHVGNGLPALKYLSRYLYRGVIREQDLVTYDADARTVTFRYREGKSGEYRRRTMDLVDFVWLLLQHVLPKGFRREREYRFLHHNAPRLRPRLQIVLRVVLPILAKVMPAPFHCPLCAAPMIVRASTPRFTCIT